MCLYYTLYKMYEKEFWNRYWKLTIIGDWKQKYNVLCKCDCWKIKEIRMSSIRYWTSKSCWCLQRETAREMLIKYDQDISKNLHTIYKSIRTRCYNKNSKAYKDYWWRWIKCKWNCFSAFYNDMAWTYKKWLSIDRIDNNWNYCKENCRRATSKEQSINKRNVKKILFRWKYYIIPELSKISWIWVETIRRRIKKWRNIEDIMNIKNKYK